MARALASTRAASTQRAPRLSGEIPVNTTTADDQRDPAIAADGSGGFTVAWMSYDGSARGVYARRFFEPPETLIDSGPAGLSNDATPTFSFSSDKEGSSFECQLDDNGFLACSPPHATGTAPDGPHSFEVRADRRSGQHRPQPRLAQLYGRHRAPRRPRSTPAPPA